MIRIRFDGRNCAEKYILKLMSTYNENKTEEYFRKAELHTQTQRDIKKGRESGQLDWK